MTGRPGPALRLPCQADRRDQVDDVAEVGVTVYIETEDVKGTLDRAVAAGAELVMEPSTIPGVVELATFRDPEGNLLGLTRNLSNGQRS